MPQRKRRRGRHSVLVLIALLCGSLFACGESDEPLPPAERIILIALDGADWAVIEALTRDGALPNIARMRAEGAAGPLRSLEPIFSPVIWATVSTGVRPEEHGIQSFTVEFEGRRVPVTSNLVRRSRVWEILSRRGRSVGVVGWWTTWPADPVNGFLLSERTWPLVLGEDGWPVTSQDAAAVTRRTHPEELYGRVSDQIVTRNQLTAEDLARFDVSGALGTVGFSGPAVADMYAKDISFLRMTERLVPEFRPEFASVYLELPDAVSHYFWQHWRYSRHVRFEEPTIFSTPPGNLDSKTAVQIGINFEKAYAFADEAIGRLLALADDRTLVLLVSDHGYGETPPGKQIRLGDDRVGPIPDWHRLDGILLAWGYGVEPGAVVIGASVLDVTPTVLYALGEPTAEDLEGRVLSSLFRTRFLMRKIESVASLETGEPRPDAVPLPSPEDEEHLEMLRALGYVE